MIYLDHAATTPVCPEARETVVRVLEGDVGNPSSGHTLGQRARALIEEARAIVAGALGCDPAEIIFTSGGTEASGMVFGAHSRGELLVTALEHAAVAEAAALARGRGAKLTVVPPDAQGRVSASAVEAALTPGMALVSAMLVCNETGAVLPVADIAAAVRRTGRALVHTDMAQGFLKVASEVRALGVDFASVSGHKIGAPQGVGALYVRRGVPLRPLLGGGGQERGLRPGTEPVALIAAFGAAVNAVMTRLLSQTEAQESLKQYALGRLPAAVPGFRFVPPHDAPHILSFALPGVPGAVAQRMLSDAGLCLSTGSACSRGKKSRVLLAMRQPPEVIDGALRCSFGPGNARADIDTLAEALAAIAERVTR